MMMLLTFFSFFKPLHLSGYVEGEFVYITPTTSGILRNLYVERGDTVDKNKMLFALDTVELKSTIISAQSDIQESKAQLKADEAEFKRGQKLIVKQAISHSDYDAREAKYRETLAKIRHLNQTLINAQKNLQDAMPKSLYKAYVQDTFFRPGEYVVAGKPVISLLPPENIKIRFFMPQNQIHKLKVGMQISVSYDGAACPVKAKINYISNTLEYTPPVIYSVESRDKLVFMIEAKPINPPTHFRPGLPVDISLGE